MFGDKGSTYFLNFKSLPLNGTSKQIDLWRTIGDIRSDGCTEPVTEKPLNIVYIMTDDHTAQMMSCYDKRYMDTPNLDRIANEGYVLQTVLSQTL